MPLLSAKEIVWYEKTLSQNVVSFTTKEFEPNGSVEEQNQIQSILLGINNVISTERVKKIGSLSQAKWNPELQMAEVVRQIGSHWFKMGHVLNKKLYIYPEEALYLLECGHLELTYNEVPLSIQRAYFLLLENRKNVSLENYRVYSYLSSAGFKVLRHSSNKIFKHKKEEKNLKREIATLNPNCETLSSKKVKSDEIQNTLDININLKEIISQKRIFHPYIDLQQSELNFDYDIYLFSSKKNSVKKNNSTLPNYRVIVHRGEESMPSFQQIARLSQKFQDNVPVVNAIVFLDHIAFYLLNSIIVPDANDA